MSRPAPADPFFGIVPDDAAIGKLLEKPLAEKRLVIYFTPRSSSTRLTEILAATKAMGQANEVLNPGFVGRVAKNWKVADIATYTRLLPRQHIVGGVWSCEVTAHHLRHLFSQDLTPFLEVAQPAVAVWLIRRDIVAQAVSLAKMVNTNVGHSFISGQEVRQAADAAFTYDSNEILYWLHHIRAAELECEQMFRQHGIVPLRLCYEDLTRTAPRKIVDMLTDHAGWPRLPGQPEDDSGLANQKIGTDKNTAFADRFRAQNARLLAGIEADRAPMLARLHHPEAPVPSLAELRQAAARQGSVIRPRERLRLAVRGLGASLGKSLSRLRQRG